MTRRRYKRKAGSLLTNWKSRTIGPFGQTQRVEQVESAQKDSMLSLREPKSPGKKPEQESIRIFAALKRISPRVIVFLCVAVAVIIISVTLFVRGNDRSNNTMQAIPVNQPSGDSAPQASSVPEPASSPTSSDSSETGLLGSIVFMEGMSDPLVAFVQQRLMDLNYMDDAQTTELYGPLTEQAVMSFQRQAELPIDGCVGSQTYSMLISPDAPQYAVGLGAQGSDVEDMIYRLYELGYIDSCPDTFTKAVKTAVEKFQELNELVVDGIIGGSTKKMLYSDDAKEYTHESDDQSSSTNVTGSITKKTNLNPAKLEEVLPSALKGLGEALYNGEQQYDINSLFVLSIINYESGNGTSSLAQNQNNLGGIKEPQAGYRTFSSKAECVEYMYDLLSSKYIGRGLTTIPEIGEVYCPGDTWATNVTENMQDLIAQCN